MERICIPEGSLHTCQIYRPASMIGCSGSCVGLWSSYLLVNRKDSPPWIYVQREVWRPHYSALFQPSPKLLPWVFIYPTLHRITCLLLLTPKCCVSQYRERWLLGQVFNLNLREFLCLITAFHDVPCPPLYTIFLCCLKHAKSQFPVATNTFAEYICETCTS